MDDIVRHYEMRGFVRGLIVAHKTLGDTQEEATEKIIEESHLPREEVERLVMALWDNPWSQQ